jgi:hypothetical protein
MAISPAQKSKSEKIRGKLKSKKFRRLKLNTKNPDFPPKIVDFGLHSSLFGANNLDFHMKW